MVEGMSGTRSVAGAVISSVVVVGIGPVVVVTERGSCADSKNHFPSGDATGGESAGLSSVAFHTRVAVVATVPGADEPLDNIS